MSAVEEDEEVGVCLEEAGSALRPDVAYQTPHLTAAGCDDAADNQKIDLEHPGPDKHWCLCYLRRSG